MPLVIAPSVDMVLPIQSYFDLWVIFKTVSVVIFDRQNSQMVKLVAFSNKNNAFVPAMSKLHSFKVEPTTKF